MDTNYITKKLNILWMAIGLPAAAQLDPKTAKKFVITINL